MGRSRKRRTRGGFGPLLAAVFLLGLAAAAVWLYIVKYMPGTERADERELFGAGENEVALILNDQLQETQGIWESGQIYLPVDWVDEYVNGRFYWDEGEQLLVYTLPEEIVYADASSQGEQGPLLQVRDGGAYLSLGLVQNYSDIRAEAFVSGAVKRVFIDTVWEEYETAQVKRASRLRVQGGIKSPVVTELARGDGVKILETMETWSKVRTDSGYIGYLPNRRLTGRENTVPVSQFEAPVYTSISMEEKVRLGFHQVTVAAANQTLDAYAQTAEGMNVIVPTWFNVTANDGSYTSLASREYVDRAHELGLQVWAMVENVSTSESVKNLDTKELMSSTARRGQLIGKLMEEADRYGFDGFNLDFESLKAEAGPHYVQFIRELSVSCRQRGLVLSVDNYVPTAYSAFYNRKEQGIVADYVIVMAYDEHYAGGEAGSVSSLSYVKNGIADTLKEVPKEKVIVGLPFYTRVWTTAGGKTTSKAYGITRAKQWVEENGMELTWQEETGQYYGELEDESGLHQLWMEEERSLGEKVGAVQESGAAGVAGWKLGFESSEIWEIMNAVR